MDNLVCESCQSSGLIKQGRFYVCQRCGRTQMNNLKLDGFQQIEAKQHNKGVAILLGSIVGLIAVCGLTSLHLSSSFRGIIALLGMACIIFLFYGGYLWLHNRSGAQIITDMKMAIAQSNAMLAKVRAGHQLTDDDTKTVFEKKAEEKERTKAIIKGAVVGSVVAGDVGAIVGAAVAKDKLDNKENKK